MNSLCLLGTPLLTSSKSNSRNYTYNSLSTFSTFSPTVSTSTVGVAFNSSLTRMVYCYYNTGQCFYSTSTGGLSGSWATPVQFSTSSNTYQCISLTNDGTRGVVAVRGGRVSYFTWPLANSAPNSLVLTPDTNSRNYNGLSMTSDGSRIVVCADYAYYATWDSANSNYTVFTQTLDSASPDGWYTGIATTANGDRIIYGDLFTSIKPRYATWNGSNYTSATTIGSTFFQTRTFQFSSDGYTVFMTHNSTLPIYYATYNSTTQTYSEFVSTGSSSFNGAWCLYLSSNNSILFVNPNYSSATQLQYAKVTYN